MNQSSEKINPITQECDSKSESIKTNRLCSYFHTFIFIYTEETGIFGVSLYDSQKKKEKKEKRKEIRKNFE